MIIKIDPDNTHGIRASITYLVFEARAKGLNTVADHLESALNALDEHESAESSLDAYNDQ